MKTEWWLYRTARISKHRSKIGPFKNLDDVQAYLKEVSTVSDLHTDWYKISIFVREVKNEN